VVKNSLPEGQVRLGWLFDGNPDTPDVAVMLQNTGEQIVLTVPIKDEDAFDTYMRWFGRGIHFGDDPDRTKFSYRPPRVLIFQDDHGTVVLVGCRAAGMSSNLFAGLGGGRIVPNFAILDGRNPRYESANGLRSEIPGLSHWAGLTSVAYTPTTDDDGRLQRLDVQAESPSELSLTRSMNLTLRPTWRTSLPDEMGTFAVHDVVQLQTTMKQPSPLENHLEEHVAVRELLVVSAWKRFGFSRLLVNRDDDPKTVASGDPIGARWAEIITHRLHKPVDGIQSPHFMFTFHDIGRVGVHRWRKMRFQYERAIQPFIGIADQESTFWRTRMVQSGIALEALGYQLAIDAGRSALNSRGQLSYMDALGLVLDGLKYNPLNDPEDWKTRSRDCYMGVKHADRPVPDSLVLANTYRENLLIFRLWVASRLGVSATILKARMSQDPHAADYVLID
jgi:hypothetical protein